MTRASLKVLHTSDVHIGAFTGLESRDVDRCLRSFRAVVDIGIAEKVDLLLIAGDFFDHDRLPQRVIDSTLEQLVRLPMPTVILPGNHDSITPDSPYRRMDLSQAKNVHLIEAQDGETIPFPDLDAAVWGRPHHFYDDFKPLQNPPPRGPESWQIAMAHGHYVRDHRDWGRSWPILPEEIDACSRDYVALGHWDAHMVLPHSPVVACYPGSPTWTGLSALVHLHGENGSRRVDVERIEVRRS